MNENVIPPYLEREWRDLLKRLQERTTATQHPYVTHSEGQFLTRHHLWQPGHTLHRSSPLNEDLSDDTQFRRGYEYAQEMGWI